MNLSINGWSSNCSDPVIGLCSLNQGETYVISTLDTSRDSQISDFISKITFETVDEAEKKFECDVVGIVTDNGESYNPRNWKFREKI